MKEDAFDWVKFGNRLKKRRVQLNFTQQQLAEKMGIHQSSLSAHESGKKGVSVPIVAQYCKKLACSADELLGT